MTSISYIVARALPGYARTHLTPNEGNMMRNDLHEHKVDLACALRWADRLGLSEGICNHFSLAVDESGETFLVNPQGLHWSEIQASDIVLCRHDGEVLEGKHKVEETAFFIHSRLHLKHPNAGAVLHTHMPYATSFTLLENCRLEMVEQNALRFHNRIAYDDNYGGVAFSSEEGDRITAAMQGKDIGFLAHHGVVVCGQDLPSAFDDLYYLERACQVQALARSQGLPFRKIPEAVVEETARQIAEDNGVQRAGHFQAIKRTLEKESPEIRF
jgi:ribulose-5-phosphate 4-epimerase/fuculose-1-phosphate aldolase